MSKLEQAIKHIKSGEKTKGRELLKQIIQIDPNNEVAWLWMSATVTDLKQRQYCFEQVLRINPNNQKALVAMQKMGIDASPSEKSPSNQSAKSSTDMEDRQKTKEEKSIKQDSSTRIWVNPNNGFDRMAILADDAFIIVNPPKEKLDFLKEQIEQDRNSMQLITSLKPKVLSLSRITKIRANKHNANMSVFYTQQNDIRFETVFFENTQVRNQVLEALQRRLGTDYTRTVKKQNIFRAMLTPGAVLAIITFFTYAFYVGAQEMGAGQDPTITGRNRLLKNLIVGIVSAIGPTGVLVVGGIVILICLVWLFKNIAKPPVIMEVSPKKS